MDHGSLGRKPCGLCWLRTLGTLGALLAGALATFPVSGRAVGDINPLPPATRWGAETTTYLCHVGWPVVRQPLPGTALARKATVLAAPRSSGAANLPSTPPESP